MPFASMPMIRKSEDPATLTRLTTTAPSFRDVRFGTNVACERSKTKVFCTSDASSNVCECCTLRSSSVTVISPLCPRRMTFAGSSPGTANCVTLCGNWGKLSSCRHGTNCIAHNFGLDEDLRGSCICFASKVVSPYAYCLSPVF